MSQKWFAIVSEFFNSRKASNYFFAIIIVDDEMRAEVHRQVSAALESNTEEKDISKLVKNMFDLKYGPTWHCIVGSDFRAFV
jgi:dynein light chain LC8-type